MKQVTVGVVAMLAGAVLLTGCGKKQETPVAPAKPIAQPTPMPAPAVAPQAPTTVLDLAASARNVVDQAMALAKQGKYQEALTLLQQKSAEVQGNPEAKGLIDNAITQIKQMMADAATKAATKKLGDTTTKALGGLMK